MPQFGRYRQRGVRGRVVLHVKSHRRASAGGRLADLPGVVEGDLLAVARQRLPDCGKLDRHLRGTGQAGAMQRFEQVHVSRGDPFGLSPIQGVLTEIVDCRREPGTDEIAGHSDGVRRVVSGDEPGDNAARDRRLLHDGAQSFTA